jgi:hypothetical protein
MLRIKIQLAEVLTQVIQLNSELDYSRVRSWLFRIKAGISVGSECHFGKHNSLGKWEGLD